MKKSAVVGGVVVILIAAWTGATWYTGKRMEAESQERIAAINKKLDETLPGYGVKIEQISFDRGFFSSHARYGVSGGGGAGGSLAVPSGVIEIDVTADHGPFPLKALMRGNVMPQLAFVHAELARTDSLQPLFSFSQGKTPVSIDQAISYDGSSSGTVDIAPMRINESDGAMDFSGATIKGSYSPSTQALQLAMQMASLSGNIPADPSTGAQGGQFRIEGVAIKGDSHPGKSKLDVGSSDLSIKHIEIKSAASGGPISQIALDDVRQVADSHETGDTIGGQVSLQIGGLKANGVDLGNGQLVLKLAGLNGTAAYNLAQAYNRIAAGVRKQMLADVNGNNADDGGKSGTDMAELPTLMQAVLAGSPTASIDPLLWKTGKGESRITVNLVLKQPSAPMPTPTSPDTLKAFWLQAIKSVDAKVNLSQPMLRELMASWLTAIGATADQANKKATEQVATLAGMGQLLSLTRADGDNLLSDFHYADGKMQINGRTPNLGSLLGGQ